MQHALHFLKLALFAPAVCCGGLLVLLASCGTTTSYYMLSADRTPSLQATDGRSIVIGPVRLPDYVDRGELVFESGPNQMEIPSTVLWAGSLNETFTRVLAADLAGRLQDAQVHPHPWIAGAGPQFRVRLDVGKFHSVSGGDARLTATWSVLSEPVATVVSTGSASLSEPVAGDGYAAVVAAESRLVGRLADELAKSLRRAR